MILAQKESELLWIINTAPFFLGVFASFGGRQMDKVQQKNLELKEKYKQMAQLRELADEANKAKGAFLANMSHEIRTPMNAIIGLSYLALKSDLNEKQHGQLSKIHNSSQSLMRIIDDILDFSKIEAGKLSFESVSFNHEKLITEVSELVNVKLRNKRQVEYVLEYDQNIPEFVDGDPVRIRQVLLNLLDNAVKFTSSGEICLRCRRMPDESGKIRLCFTISDTGIGMNQEQLNRLFTPFQQADISTTRKFGGTGLGLAISRRLVQMMSGDITAHSKEGQGSTFRFQILLDPSGELPETNYKQSDLHGLRVLLVDDSDSAREVLTEMLESFGFHVFQAADAKHALDIYLKHIRASEVFDLIIADWYMPDMDGLEMIEEIQKSKGRSPSVLMVTAYGAEHLRDATKQDLIDGYLVKPISPSGLFDAIQNVLHRKKYSGMAGSSQTDLSELRLKLHGLRVLVVDDNEINRELATELLRDVGIVAEQVNNGQEAIVKLTSDPEFDCVLMDIQMPVKDGLTATRELRKNRSFDAMPILAMTAHAMTGEREKSLAAGMNDHITKPIHPDVFYASLLAHLNRNQRRSRECRGDEETEARIKHETIPAIRGIDTDDGLRRIGGKTDVYKKLLLAFSTTYSRSDETLEMLIVSGNIKGIETFMHTAAGVCGNIGAKDLYVTCRDLSLTLKQNQESFSDSLQQECKATANELRDISEHIKAMLQPEHLLENIRNLPEPPVGLLENTIEEAIRRANDYDPTASDLLEDVLSAYYFPEHTANALLLSVRSLSEMDFDKALVYLEKTRTK